MRPFFLIILSVAMIILGYFAGVAKSSFSFSRPSEPLPVAQQGIPSTEIIYEIDQIRSGRKSFDEHIVSIVGGVCVGPDGEAYLIPDDDESLREEPPGNGRYKLQLADWKFRGLRKGDVYPRCVIKGYFGTIDDGIYFDALSPIFSVSWNGSIPKRKGDP